ncbi:glycosyltransferase family 4 protein [Methanosarcina sp. KYL-1]|uniref:glycosyltransferase family 4 protein n=1 Tax=Methanosarcina sp. KYL-1 TaxID=2602068 RepID=UPI00210086D8|nr:glycosyltransferase family 4 protein [Methanosarcina sp. KYL-1]MCQ1535096.1 glycosyltransferase family 4 protein [Methanosarcina sp. KYL-1]
MKKKSSPSICICTTHSLQDKYSGGVNRITEMAKKLSECNVDVYIVDGNRNNYYHAEKAALNEFPYPSYVKLFYVFNIFLFIFRKSIGCLIGPSHELSHILSEYNIFMLVKLFYVTKVENIDALQGEHPSGMGVCAKISKIFGLPSVFSEHNVEWIRIERQGANKIFTKILQSLELKYCRKSNVIIVVSEVDKNFLISNGVSKEKIQVVPNSIDCNIYVPSGPNVRMEFSLDAITLIFHGTLDYVSNKEAVELISKNIMPQINKRYPFVKLLLVGKNPPSIDNPNIIITGPVENLNQYISSADIAIVPLVSGGGTRIKILEYMASGKAIVSTAIGAEGLDASHNHDILIANSLDEFVRYIEVLINSPELRKELGNNARKKAQTRYDWINNCKLIKEIYLNLVD